MSKTFKQFTESYYTEFQEILQEAIDEFITENRLSEEQKDFLLSEKIKGFRKAYGRQHKGRKKGVLRPQPPQSTTRKTTKNPLQFKTRRLPVNRYY